MYARRLLQCLTVAARPLRLEELAEVLAFDFDDAPGGIPQLNADWRREDQERAVLSTCSSLITIVHDDNRKRVVQFSHFSVKEFLTSDRLAIAAEDISFYHIDLEPAHAILAQACLSIFLRLDDCTREATIQQFPLAEYALIHWVEHALFENVSLHIKDGIEDLFDAEKPHFSRWIRARGNTADFELWRDHDTLHEAMPIYQAAFCGFLHVFEKLIREHPEHVNSWGGSFGTALHAASKKNHLKLVQSLLRHGADVNAPGLWGWTPLPFASRWGHLEIVRCLLEHGADVNAKDMYGSTPLHRATSVGHYEVVRTLLKHNADTSASPITGRTPLHMASFRGRVDIVRLLLNHDADPKARDRDHQTSLHEASSEGHLDVACLLLEHGAEVDAEDNRERTAYQVALDKGHSEVVRLLLVYGAKSRM